jgi:membrane-bound metal-dependent hydrolase YbcI (DUF457 family)
VPFPVAHGLIGASVVAALLPSSRSRIVVPLLIGAFLGISPDFDYALNWLRVGRGGWHHGFTHSIPFALLIGLVMIILMRDWKARSFIVFSAAFASHTLLDYLLTESRGVALWWPFTDHRYKLRLPNPIDYTWDDSSFWETTMDVLKIVVTELLIFVPVLLLVVLIRRAVVKRSRLKQSLGVSVSVLVVMFLATSPAFSQDKQRKVFWPEIPYHANAAKSSISTIVPQIEVLEIVDVTIGGKPVTLGEDFTADDEWLKNLTVRIKNISRTTITSVQLNLFLPQVMPGGPMVTLCYGCGNVGKNIDPGEEVEMKTVFYDWLAGEITARSSFAKISKAEIYEMRLTVSGGGKMLVSQCVKTTRQKNACIPNP